MTESGRIKRSTQTLPYFYYIEPVANPLRRIAINWARLWLLKQSKSWERITIDYQTSTCTVANTITGVERQIYIVERGFKLPGDNVLVISDDAVNNWREAVLCEK